MPVSLAKKRATIRDVARRALVSHQTVSRVINGESSIAPATRFVAGPGGAAGREVQPLPLQLIRRHVAHDDADRVRLAAGQAASDVVGTEAELGDGLLDARQSCRPLTGRSRERATP